jgi:hypothetical protein
MVVMAMGKDDVRDPFRHCFQGDVVTRMPCYEGVDQDLAACQLNLEAGMTVPSDFHVESSRSRMPHPIG